jgi:steroid delta-isomerase-like uncharacterized protein
VSVEQNKAALKRIIEEVWNKGDMSAVADLIAPSYVYHSPMGMDFRGPDGFKQFVSMTRGAFPDVRMRIDDMVAEGDKVAAQIWWAGTFKGNLGPMEPTGKLFNMTSAYFFRFENGKEEEAVAFTDMLEFYQKLGVKPPTQ